MRATRSPVKWAQAFLALASFLGAAPFPAAASTGSVVEGNTAFALDLYGQLKNTPGNLFFSPYSISTALAMTYAGARRETEKQMGQVFRFDKDQRRVHAAFGELQKGLGEASKQKGIELSIANALWAQKGHPFEPAFLKAALDKYQAKVKQADFKTGAGAAREEINHWVAKTTKDKIQDILPPDSLNNMTRLVLANAIYFKGIWAKPYEKPATSTQPFHISKTRNMDVPLMYHFDEVRYMEESDFQAVELPYSSGGLSMVILLPRGVDGCGGLETRLTPALLSRALKEMKKQRVEILLPRFKLESSFNLNNTLVRMGMPDAFSEKADFSGMDGTKMLFISDVFHKAWGAVNEEGTEAAAATAAVMRTKGIAPAPPPCPLFRADHPFIFFIRDTHSSTLLFVGRLTEPTQ